MEHQQLPVLQHNASLSDEMIMRVGVPHRGGGLAFHAFKEGHSVMVSANAFWDPKHKRFAVPGATNLTDLDWALDSAGFTAMQLWQAKGTQRGMAGVFPWTYAEYLEFAALMNPSWYSQPDLCCEPEIAADQATIDFRINATATLLEGCLRVIWAWQNELAKTCSAEVIANMIRPPVPVIQGWTVDDYLRSLDLMVSVWQRWQPWLAPPALIGIGSVCRRTLKHPKHGLYAVLSALEGRLPAGSRLHLFGVKGAALDDLKMHKWIASADSMAFDMSARVKAREAGKSNTIEHRSQEMSRWMAAATTRMRPKVGDQFRLSFAA
ncbi:deazapurine DNA modification protein DpdA family protein [Rubrivivax gelatinosus]|uniref:deazapurine DNA modification protein DpdA family protein n=1 Tax=Rubrivivax gelatinosus TaxID=28068 RepID=UPI0005C23B6B|nr:hypothetical protein [Rubrivivax gelatinosus]MBG6083038.1 hypothetical protein [Rubrivivax gelatinosus]